MQKTDGNTVQIITMWIRACGFRHSTLFTHCLRLLERQRAKSHICSEDHLTCKASNAHLDRKSSLAVWMCLSPQACMVETWPPVWRYWKWVESTTLRLGTDLRPEPHCLQQRFVWSSAGSCECCCCKVWPFSSLTFCSIRWACPHSQLYCPWRCSPVKETVTEQMGPPNLGLSTFKNVSWIHSILM